MTNLKPESTGILIRRQVLAANIGVLNAAVKLPCMTRLWTINMKTVFIFLVIWIQLNAFLFGQCTDISIGRKMIDSTLLSECENIIAEKYLAINFGNGFLKYEGWGLLATGDHGILKIRKFTLKKNNKIECAVNLSKAYIYTIKQQDYEYKIASGCVL